MKAAQQGGGGGGGQHGSLLAGGTALPGGPSPQPGQPGSLMQGGAYRTTYHGEESDYPDRLLDNLRNVENRLIIIYTCTYIWRIKAEDRIGHRFCMCAFNEIEIFIQSYRFSDRCSDRLNETTFARFKRINRVRGKRKEKKKVGKNSVQLLSSRHECNSRISDRKI